MRSRNGGPGLSVVPCGQGTAGVSESFSRIKGGGKEAGTVLSVL